ncbi:MAG TPA: efflux RND transporter periplasmic adaptor subunit [Gemmataceae bacterium]|nr:efflux RND transporter periplasmic adaptor subunit [Gemmataceae bacterium]
MKVTTRLTPLLVVLGLAAAVTGCNKEPSLAESPPLEVVVGQPVSETIADWDIYTGTVDPRDSVEVRSRVRGHIKEVRFKEGEEIAAGTELFTIDSGPFEAELKQAKGLLANWEAKLKFAEERFVVYKPLAEKGSVAADELNKVTADKGEALGGVDSAKGKILDAELNIGYCKISAPITGKVGEAMVTKGNLVGSSGQESLLTTIVGVDPMYVNFYVNERSYQSYRKLLLKRAESEPAADKGAKVVIPVEMAIGGDPRFSFKGVVDFVDNRVDPATSSIKVRAKFENPKGPDNRRPLTAGMFARVRVAVADPHKATLIADRAILSDQSLKYVLVVNKEKKNVVERVDIDASNRLQESGLRAVDAGLKGDEWVIVEGVNRARPGVTVAPTEGKMPRRPESGK